ncbi:MAG: beta-galactosidase trimerization domain-containing protein [Acidobacteria bacterium]|nr:beta-galactosidase trimerization domain-containing protein [Acidobacteriota bacterium]
MNRREFLGTAALAAAAPRSKVWIDPALAALPSRPWRKVHLDFHNSEYMPRIGEKFDAGEFGDRLAAARVDSIVVFAKDMHGYFYYPSKYGPVHPGLKFDLLGAQVEACRQRKIAVYAYYCTTWDNYLAEQHPEWLVIKRDRTNYLPKFDATPGWTALCLSYEPFVQLMLDHAREFVSRYPLDGAWFDMPVPINRECFCRECLRQLRAHGLDPSSRAVQCEHKHALHKAFLDKMRKTVTAARPGCQLDYNGQAVYGLGERVRYMDNIDLEALPSGAAWGYYYFPLVTRYARSFGVTTYGMTGRFKATWADFGGLKLPAQLETEVASIVANAARCDIGDQMPADGRLDPAVYHVIGKAYGRIQALEPYLDQAAPVSEAALIVSGLPLEGPNTSAHLGWVKLLMECRVQFDVVEPDAAWERYGLVILPDETPIDAKTASRLHAFVAQGGAVLASHLGGLLSGGERSWLERYGLTWAGKSPFQPAYMVPKENFTGDIPEYEYALYQGASQWRAAPPAAVVAQLGEPLFQRGPQHYTSHRQTPFDHETQYAAIARSGRVALFGFPLGTSYFEEGYWVYRAALKHVLKQLLPAPLVESDAPVSTEIEVTRQAARAGVRRQERYLVHIVNWSANRGAPRHPVFYEEPIPLTGIRVRLNVPLTNATVTAAVSGSRLAAKLDSGGVEVVVPRIPVHEVLCFEAG